MRYRAVHGLDCAAVRAESEKVGQELTNHRTAGTRQSHIIDSIVPRGGIHKSQLSTGDRRCRVTTRGGVSMHLLKIKPS